MQYMHRAHKRIICVFAVLFMKLVNKIILKKLFSFENFFFIVCAGKKLQNLLYHLGERELIVVMVLMC